MASKSTTNEPIRYNNEEIRIVLVGKTGVGKSATANTILGNKCFESKFSFKSLTKNCDKAYGEVDGQKVAVIDTPGLFDTSIDEQTTIEHILQSISYAAPGPHIFLVVIKLGRFTEEKKKMVQKIQDTFGEESLKYSMVLFTHGDLLEEETIEDFLAESEELQELVSKCNGQYHVFNNNLKDRSQVTELLNKIRNITEKNGGRHYTTEMFQAAEKVIEVEKERILKEKEEKMQKEREELEKEIKEKYEEQMKKEKAEMERQKELMAQREREMEEQEKKIKEKYKKEMKKARDEMERQKELMAQRQREMEEEMREMKKMQKVKVEGKVKDSNSSTFQLWSPQRTIASKSARNEPIRYNNDEIRIVLVGKTGAGKSAAGNNILGKQSFLSKFSFKSLTKNCAKAYGEVDGQKVAVIDTPGLFDTSTDEQTTTKDIVQSISYASPGPHMFLVVIRLGRFTEEEKNTVQKIQKIFGNESNKYSMVLFTHGDLLEGEPIEDFLAESKELQELVSKCNGQYHVFNNELKDRSQVTELLNKIRNITEKNGGSHYTTEMFQKAENAIEEEKERILKEKEEEMRKEREEQEKKIKEKYEEQMKKEKDDMERQKELMAQRDREMEEKTREMKEMQERKAREEAENSPSILGMIGKIIEAVIAQYVKSVTDFVTGVLTNQKKD